MNGNSVQGFSLDCFPNRSERASVEAGSVDQITAETGVYIEVHEDCGKRTASNHVRVVGLERSLFWILSLLLFLTACNATGNLHMTPTSARIYHQHIEMTGRLSVHYQHNNQPQAVHVNFTWSQTPEQVAVALNSPTGQTLAVLLVNAQGAQLQRTGYPAQFADDANQLILQMLGWPLPVNGLRDWLQGFLDNAHTIPITSVNSGGTYFLVDGWNLRYAAWENVSVQTDRPKRLDLTRQTEQAGLVSLRIVIDRWDTQ